MDYGTLQVGRTDQPRSKAFRLRTIVIFCLFLSAIYFVHKRFCSVPSESNKTPHRTTPNDVWNCTMCLVEVPEERARKPAIGFDLTDSYVTATIILPSGEHINVGPIYGNKEYLDAIEHFSKNSSKHTASSHTPQNHSANRSASAPPYNYWYDPPGGVFAGLYDRPRELLRSIRKKLGWAATPQVGALSALLVSMRNAASGVLESRHITPPTVDAVVLSSLDLGALYDEDLYDAASHAGLSAAAVPAPPRPPEYPFSAALLSDWKFIRQPKHVDAALAGFGLGLCKRYNSTEGCRSDEKAMHRMPPAESNLLSVLVTRRGVGLESRRRKFVAWTDVLYWQQHNSYYDAELGVLKLLAVWGKTEEEVYWQKLRVFVGHMVEMTIWSNVTDVFLIGESAGFPKFKDNVVRAIMDSGLRQQMGEPLVHERDQGQNLFVASRGAANIAKRILVAPTDCGYPKGVPQCRP